MSKLRHIDTNEFHELKGDGKTTKCGTDTTLHPECWESVGSNSKVTCDKNGCKWFLLIANSTLRFRKAPEQSELYVKKECEARRNGTFDANKRWRSCFVKLRRLEKNRDKRTWRQPLVGTTEIYILVVFLSLKPGFMTLIEYLL